MSRAFYLGLARTSMRCARTYIACANDTRPEADGRKWREVRSAYMSRAVESLLRAAEWREAARAAR